MASNTNRYFNVIRNVDQYTPPINAGKFKIFLLEYENQFHFTYILLLDFPLYRGGIYNTLSDTKVLVKINLIYQFDNVSPDFDVQIFDDEILVYSKKCGIDSYPNRYNHLNIETLIDFKNVNNMSVKLVKNDFTTNIIHMNRNSFISLEIL